MSNTSITLRQRVLKNCDGIEEIKISIVNQNIIGLMKVVIHFDFFRPAEDVAFVEVVE